eukprot:CAMPEP_0171715556 /NCGR_PEP_ID=MMETSP0991-20121206/18937_1 /TAXON_ID=483369 /ORGANISM="non described non described, Strain CCMP2098" /LENGTH=245 /DNA_ID=CAMNT_0012306463 /DNA_START=482 /DNA_END=1216 /DNA_ORIENTATION=+
MEELDDLVPEPDENGKADMTHQGWRRLDDIIWKMGLKILILDVSFNKIEELPEQIGDLILLKELNISNNQLEVLPKSIGDLRCLRRFQCNNNSIELVPDEIGQCYMLEDLIANDNALRQFPASVIGCAALNVCDLRNNQLESVPCELGSLVTMRGLFLEGNESMAHQIPPYCLSDSSLCIFLLKMEFGFRADVENLRAANLELEYKIREREEYNLRIKDEFDESSVLLRKANARFPHEYVNCKKW